MTVTEEQAVRTSDRREAKAIIDCDVHNALRRRDDLKAYLAAKWHPYFDQGNRVGVFSGQYIGARPQSHPYRVDSTIGDRHGGSDFELMCEQLLDRHNVSHAILHPINDLLTFSAYGPAAAPTVAALNDWMVDEWISRDDRLYGAISVTVEDGLAAAAEITRMAVHPRFVKVLLPIVTREGLGHAKYWPIYEAAVDAGLPVAAHVGGFSGTQTAAGWTTYYVENHTAFSQHYQTHVVSLVHSGVFERFPSLQFVLEEGGLAWLAPLMWRLDHTWSRMRDVAPHLTEPPSDVIRRHFHFTTQPLDVPDKPKFLGQIFDQLDMDDRIMFASDWPHWDYDDPTRVVTVSQVGQERHDKIMAANAERLFRFAS